MINPIVRFKNDNGNDYPDWEKCIVDDVFVERNEAHLITDDAPQLSFTIEQGVIYPEDKKTNKRDFLIKDKSSKKFLLTEYNDIIYNPANLKFGAIHRNKLGRGVVSPIYAIFKTDQDPSFMEYLVRNPRFIKRSLKYLEGTVIKLMTLKPRDFVKMKISVPCIEEQKRISDFLSKIDALIAISEKEVNKYKELKKGCLQTMFPRDGADVPEVRFPGFTDAWEQRKCEGILRPEKGAMKIGPFGSALKKEFYTEVGVKVYAQENIFQEDFSIGNYYISDERYQTLKGCKLEAGDLVISMMGTIGACAIFPEDAEPGIMNSHLLRLQLKDDIYPEYIHQLLRDSQLIRKQIDRLSVGSIMSGLSSSVVQKLVFPVPCIEEQKKIAEFLVHIDNLITLHQRECEKYRELKSGLLQKMFV